MTDVRLHAGVEAALRDYERERQPKTAALVAQGRRTARVMRIRNPLGCALRELVVRAIPVNAMVRLLVAGRR